MERGFRDAGRSSLRGADYDDYRSYDRPGLGGYLDYEPPMRDSYRSGRSSYDRADIMESLLQHRALKEQELSLQKSQLALASSLLQQRQQQEFLSKRRMSPRGNDLRQDFKRPRLMDLHPRPRNQSTGSQDLSKRRRGGRRGTRRRGVRGGSSNLQNQSSPRGQLSSDRSKSKDKNDSEKPATDDLRALKGCRWCKVASFKNFNEVREHRATEKHIKNQKLHDKRTIQHDSRRRQMQITRGCGWCNVASFKDFDEVLEHRATEKHKKNMMLYDTRVNRKSDSGRREPLKVELPPELAKFDPKVVVGQTCVLAVTGWFCKLCNKFYNNENTAKETHCMTESHFNNYKKFMFAKLKAKAEAERDAKEKAAEEERKKKEAEKKVDGDKEEPSSEQAEADRKETADGEGEKQDEEMEQNDEEIGAEGEEAGVEGEEAFAEGEDAAMDEEEGEDMIGEPEEYVDDEEAAAAEEEGVLEQEDLAGTGDVENEGAIQEEEPLAAEEPMEAEAGEDEEREEEEEAVQKKTTRAAVSSPGRGRGRGGGANRARRGRRVAK